MSANEVEQTSLMREGMPLLLAVLRGHSVQLLDGNADWPQALALAEEEHILPWVAHLLSRRAPLPLELSSRLREVERDAAITAFYWSSELKRILRAFAQEDIVVVPLKGPFLAERLYGDTALRVSYDLDLLVCKTLLARSEALLRALGFTPGAPDDYHRQWFKASTTIELHHDVSNPLAFDFGVDRALTRIQPACFMGQPCWQLAPEDELFFLCLHAVRHRFERLSLIVDLCLAFERMGVPGHATQASPDPARDNLLILGAAMARRLYPGRQIPDPTPATPGQRDRLETIADRLWSALLTERAEPLDWRALHAFYLQIEAPSKRLRRRWRHLKILLERTIEPDYEFAARFGLNRPWQVRLLRPLRLIFHSRHPPGDTEGDKEVP